MKPIVLKFVRWVNALMRKVVAFTHAAQMKLQYGKGSDYEWFDHYLDLYYQWPQSRSPFWLERGIFNRLTLKDGAHVLELCCGDGFNTHFFYAGKAGTIIAVDADRDALRQARKYHGTDTVSFYQTDIRVSLPDGPFDNIIWDAAIEHFTEAEISSLLKCIKDRLKPDGIMSGYTIVGKRNKKSLRQHKYECTSKKDLARFFTPYFKNVKVFETIYPERHNLYFWAADTVLPFDREWRFQTAQKQNATKVLHE